MTKENILKKGIVLVPIAAIAAALLIMTIPATTNAMSPGKSDAAAAAKPGSASIVDIVLANDGEFDVLQAAVVKAGLVGALDGSRQYTVFAPTDAAFVQTLGVANEAAAIDAVNGMTDSAVKNILLYHVMPGRHTSTSVLARSQYRMLNGQWLSKSELNLNKPNVSASNGVIHVINNVLLP